MTKLKAEKTVFSEKEAAMLGVLQLAFVGDTVYDLYIRTNLVAGSGLAIKKLHAQAVACVNANAQADALFLLEPHLTETELGIVRRARNAKQRRPRGIDPARYQMATGFEALLGFLHMSGQNERIARLLDIIYAKENDGAE